jgi:hypothetical protein
MEKALSKDLSWLKQLLTDHCYIHAALIFIFRVLIK